MKFVPVVSAFFLFTNLALASPTKTPETIDSVLNSPNPITSAYIDSFTKHIPDAQDKAQAKQILKTWKASPGTIVSFANEQVRVTEEGKTVVHAAWLSHSPHVLWYNGKILTSATDNPSMARVIDSVFSQKSKVSSRLMNFVLPEANAALSSDELVKKVLFLYSVNKDPLTDAGSLVERKSTGEFFPKTGWIFNTHLTCGPLGIENAVFGKSFFRGAQYRFKAAKAKVGSSNVEGFTVRSRDGQRFFISTETEEPEQADACFRATRVRDRDSQDVKEGRESGVAKKCRDTMQNFLLENPSLNTWRIQYYLENLDTDGTENWTFESCASLRRHSDAAAEKCNTYFAEKLPETLQTKQGYGAYKCLDAKCENLDKAQSTASNTERLSFLSSSKSYSTRFLEYRRLRDLATGLEILGDCCDDKVCKQKVLENFGLVLNGGASEEDDDNCKDCERNQTAQ